MNLRYWNSGPKTMKRLRLARAMPPDLRPGEVVRVARPEAYQRRGGGFIARMFRLFSK